MITAQIKDVEKVTAQAKQLSLSAGVPKEETDPTVPAWAKQPNKPTYTAAEVGALPADTKIPSKPEDVGAMPANTKIPSTAAEVGAIPVPTTATVGQTIRVSAVDESGKPSAWEAVDFPEGGGGAEVWDYEKTITLAEDAGAIDISEFDDGTPLALKKIRIIAITKNATSAGMTFRVFTDIPRVSSGGDMAKTSSYAGADKYLYGHAYCEVNSDGEVWGGTGFAVNVNRYINYYSKIPSATEREGINGLFIVSGADTFFGNKATKITGYKVNCTTGAFVAGSTFQIKGVRL